MLLIKAPKKKKPPGFVVKSKANCLPSWDKGGKNDILSLQANQG